MDKLRDLLQAARPRRDGDIIDRLNSTYSTVILVIFSAITGMFTFGGNPLQCWYPAYFKRWWIEYGNDYCYVQNTYFYPLSDPSQPHDNQGEVETSLLSIPQNLTERYDGVLPYYQWVPFILAFEALCFFIPLGLWRTLSDNSGICVRTILQMCTKDTVTTAKRDKNLKLAAKFLNYHDTVEKTLHDQNRVKSVKAHTFVCTLYLVIKLFYVVNAVCQFFILTEFLGFKRSNWGFSILRDMARGIPWEVSHKFPRITLCDFQVRVLANLHRHTVQCVLMVNMFNEKFFIFLWWWLLLMSTVTCISFFHWLFIVLGYEKNLQFIRGYLTHQDPKQTTPTPGPHPSSVQFNSALRKFVTRRLHPDGVLLLKLIQVNAGDLVAGQLTRILWDQYIEKDLDFSTSLDSTPSTARLLRNNPNGATPDTPDTMEKARSPPPRYEESQEDSHQQTTEL